jgi:hypothetical protein
MSGDCGGEFVQLLVKSAGLDLMKGGSFHRKEPLSERCDSLSNRSLFEGCGMLVLR